MKEKRFNDESDEEDFDDALLDEVSNTGQSGSRIVNGNGFPQLLSQSSVSELKLPGYSLHYRPILDPFFKSIYTGVTMETSSDIPSSSTSDSSSGTLLTHKKFVFEFPIR